MNIDIRAATVENPELQGLQGKFKLLAGKMAGICYMPDDYLSQGIQNEASSLKRADGTANSGHHSVFDHAHMTLTIEGIPKILAMLLNSTEDYVTSEKSARYTVMQPETEEELRLYEKWTAKFMSLIAKLYPTIDEKTVHKLALENARYLTSVFTPTTMAYTVSHRQWAYLVDWLGDLQDQLAKNPNPFNDKLRKSVTELYVHLGSLLPRDFSDNKDREFDFVPMQYGHPKDLPAENIANAYSVSYLGTFAQLAQAHRHRTLSYTMWFTGDRADEYGFYVPPIIAGTELEKEWLGDMNSIAYCFPQGTLVMITEEGLAKHFFLKCKERLCGRAQLEIALQTAKTLELFIENRDKLDARNRKLLESIAPNGVPVAKCGMKGFICKEVCMWGAKNWNTRKI